MIGAIISTVCGVGAVVTARIIYGRLRTMAIEELAEDHNDSQWLDDLNYAIPIIGGALLSGAVWPLSLLFMAIFISPPKTPTELEAENKKQAAYIAKLERDAGLDR